MADIDIESPGASEAALRAALFNLRSFNGCFVRRTSDLTAQNITTAALVTYQEAVQDPLSMWSAGAPTRITIDADLNGALLMAWFNTRITSDTADTWFKGYINIHNAATTTILGAGNGEFEKGSTTWAVTRTAAWVATTGDYVTSLVQTESDTSVSIEGDAYQTQMGVWVLGMP